MNDGHDRKKIIARPFRGDKDYRRVRDLLIETYPITPTGFNWEIRRWDGWRYYNSSPDWNPEWEKTVYLWQEENGLLVGAAHPENKPGYAYLQVHPDYRRLEPEMIAWAENNLPLPIDDDQFQLSVFVYEYDTFRKNLLDGRGYKKTSSGGVIRRLRLGGMSLPTLKIANGYTCRTVNPDNESDCRQIADILNAAFGRDFHTPDEYRVFTSNAPCAHKSMDLAAIAPDKSFAAYVGISYEETNRYGIFEPVCTHPEHQRRGLARALMLEGLHRLRAIGAFDVLVGTGDQIAANRLYDSIGFTEVHRERVWTRVFSR